jgi:signal transduction histidine kinase
VAGGAVFQVSDDGVGLTRAATDAAHSLGLLGMRERALQCGCTIAFEANQPCGLRVAVRVPLAAATGRADR